MQMLNIPQVDIDNQAIKVRFPVKKMKIRNIRLLFAYKRANPSQYTRVVTNRQIKADGVRWRVDATVPLQVHPSLRLFLEFRQYRAINRVNDNPLPAIGDTDDPFTGDRLAAGGPFESLVWGQADNGSFDINLFPTRSELRIERSYNLAR